MADDLIPRIKAAESAHPDSQALALVVDAYKRAFAAYKDDRAPKNYNHLCKVEKDLRRVLDDLEQGAPASSEPGADLPDPLSSPHQVWRYLSALGYRVSKSQPKRDIDNHKLVPRQGGGFSKESVRRYAMVCRLKRDPRAATPADDRPAIPVPGHVPDDVRSLIDVKRDKEEELLITARLANKERMGALVDILIVDREQQELCQAVRMHLSPMIRSSAEQVLTMLGGDPDTARELVELVGGDPDQADKLATHVMSRKPELIAMYKPYLKSALNAFATGEWYTQEMREAWAQYQRSREDAELQDIRALIALAGGDVDRAGVVLEQFYVRRLD